MYYAQYYAQEQELLSDYILHTQLCMNNSLHVADNFYKDCFISVLMNGIKYIVMLYHTIIVLLECIDHSLLVSININA